MKLAVTYPDPERATVDALAELLLLIAPTATVGIGVPVGWVPASAPHLQVILDGTPELDHPVVMYSVVRLLVRAGTTTAAKALCTVAMGLLCSRTGYHGIATATPLTGPLAAQDPDTGAELASCTVRLTLRAIPL